MLLRAGGSCLSGSLTHEVPLGHAQAQNALQTLSHSGCRGLNQEPVVSVHQEIFYTVELGTTIGNRAAAAS